MKRTRLRPGKGLARRGSLKRSSRPLRSNPTGTAPEVVEALWARSGGQCELVDPPKARCVRTATHPHHRRTRKRAGRRIDELWNLLHLCPSCHDFVHDNPRLSLERGWLLPSRH